jgi:hypothetical protein
VTQITCNSRADREGECGKARLQFAKRFAELEKLAFRLNRDLSKVELIPADKRNASEVDYSLKLNKEGSDAEGLCSGRSLEVRYDVRGRLRSIDSNRIVLAMRDSTLLPCVIPCHRIDTQDAGICLTVESCCQSQASLSSLFHSVHYSAWAWPRRVWTGSAENRFAGIAGNEHQCEPHAARTLQDTIWPVLRQLNKRTQDEGERLTKEIGHVRERINDKRAQNKGFSKQVPRLEQELEKSKEKMVKRAAIRQAEVSSLGAQALRVKVCFAQRLAHHRGYWNA